MTYNALTRQHFETAALAGVLTGPGVRRGAAGSRAQGTWVQFDLLVDEAVEPTGQCRQVGQVEQLKQTGKVGQAEQIRQTGQVGQAGQIGQIGQVGQVEPGDQANRLRRNERAASGRLTAVRFNAFGCPHVIAAANWIAQQAVGMPAAPELPESVAALKLRFAVPTEKLGRLLVVEDAWIAAVSAPPTY